MSGQVGEPKSGKGHPTSTTSNSDFKIFGQRENAWRPPGSDFTKLSKCLFHTRKAGEVRVKNIFYRAKELESKVDYPQELEASLSDLTYEESTELQVAYAELASLLLQQECFWKLRINWLTHRDSNTRFFHNLT